MLTFGISLTIILIIVIVIDGIFSYMLKNKRLIKFYQIWLRGDEKSSNFLIMAGYEKGKKLITYNDIIFKKSEYTYAILPFANLQITRKDLLNYTESEFLRMCKAITEEIYNHLNSDE